jgi:hypothetical protein
VDKEIEIIRKDNDVACEPPEVHVKGSVDQVHIISKEGIPTAILRDENNVRQITGEDSPFDQDEWIAMKKDEPSRPSANVKPGFKGRFLMVASLRINGDVVQGTGKKGAIIIVDT